MLNIIKYLNNVLTEENDHYRIATEGVPDEFFFAAYEALASELEIPKEPNKLGRGKYGMVFSVDKNVVMKITTDRSDAETFKLLSNQTEKNI